MPRPRNKAAPPQKDILEIINLFAVAAAAACDHLRPVLGENTELLQSAFMLVPPVSLALSLVAMLFKKEKAVVNRRRPKQEKRPEPKKRQDIQPLDSLDNDG